MTRHRQISVSLDVPMTIPRRLLARSFHISGVFADEERLRRAATEGD